MMKQTTLGDRLSPILQEIELTLLENYETQPHFTKKGFISIVFIFQSALMDKMYLLQDNESISLIDREKMAVKCGEELRDLVKKFTDIDTFELFK